MEPQLTRIVRQIRTGDEAMLARGAHVPRTELLWQFRAYFMCAHVRRPGLHCKVLGTHTCGAKTFWGCHVHRTSRWSGPCLGRRLSGC